MTAKQKLQQHLAELERGEAFSHERMKDMAELIDKLAAPLPVVRIEDCELVEPPMLYSIRLFNGIWLHDQMYRSAEKAFFDGNKDDGPFSADDVTHVTQTIKLDEVLNASIQEEANEAR